MTERFAVNDRVVMTANNRRGVVLREWDESFPRGGVQQVIGVRWEDGTGTAMRAAHFTTQPTESEHTLHSTQGDNDNDR